jgi:GNAT superfamily N-acetyltransferase
MRGVNMNIREIYFDDIKEIAKEYLNYFNHFEGADWHEKDVIRRLRQLTERFDYFGLGIYENGKMIGFCVGCLSQFDDGIIALLNEIFIIKSFQSKGYGSKLIKAFEDKAKSLGAFRIQLEAADDNIHRRFYNDYHQYKDTRSNIIKGKAL